MYLSLVILFAAAAHAGDLAAGWWHLDRNEGLVASAIAVEALGEDPGNFEAHRLLTLAQGSMDSAGAIRTLEAYRSWHEASPSRASAFGRAAAVSVIAVDEPDVRCAEFHDVLGALGTGTDAELLQVTLVHHQLSWACKTHADELVETLQTLATRHEPAVRWALKMRLQQKRPPRDALKAVVALLEADDPEGLRLARTVWWREIEGGAARAVKRASLAAAERALASDDPHRVTYGWLLRLAADDPRADDAEDRTDTLSPLKRGYHQRMSQHPGLLEIIRVHAIASDPEVALRLLDAVDNPPTGGWELAMFLEEEARYLQLLGRSEEALEVLTRAHLAAPSFIETGRAWGWQAVELGAQLDAVIAWAAEAADKAGVRVYHPDTPDGFEAWSEKRRVTRANLLHLEGDALGAAGRTDEGIARLREGLLLSPDDGELHYSLGVALSEHGDPAYAAEHLAMAWARADGDEEFEALARGALEPLWSASGRWHHGGLDAYLTQRREELTDDSGEDEDTRSEEDEDHPLVGQPFPLVRASDLDGEQFDVLGDGITVVDLWATWCGPCLMAMPHLQEVAETYADRSVRVVGLSVDKKLETVTRFFRGVEPPAYELAFAGRDGMEAAQVDGIPATFVVDASGTVMSVFTGFSDGDARMQETLEELLTEQ